MGFDNVVTTLLQGFYNLITDILFDTCFLDDPYWNLDSPSTIEAPIGVNVTVATRYAYGSRGYGNNGTELLFSLEVMPIDSGREPYTEYSDVMADDDGYLFTYNFTMSTALDGMFDFQGNEVFI